MKAMTLKELERLKKKSLYQRIDLPTEQEIYEMINISLFSRKDISKAISERIGGLR